MRETRSPTARTTFSAGAIRRITLSTRSRVRSWSDVIFAIGGWPSLLAPGRMAARHQPQHDRPRRMLSADRAGAVQHARNHNPLALVEPVDAGLRDLLGARPHEARQVTLGL